MHVNKVNSSLLSTFSRSRARSATGRRRARRGDGPSLIECKTYRHRRHTERADQLDSRSSEELAFWKSRDPIEHVRRHLLTSSDPLSDADWQEIDRQVLADIEASVVFAKASPVPQLDAALDDVFAE